MFYCTLTIYNQLLGDLENQCGGYGLNVLPVMTVNCVTTEFILRKQDHFVLLAFPLSFVFPLPSISLDNPQYTVHTCT